LMVSVSAKYAVAIDRSVMTYPKGRISGYE